MLAGILYYILYFVFFLLEDNRTAETESQLLIPIYTPAFVSIAAQLAATGSEKTTSVQLLFCEPIPDVE